MKLSSAGHGVTRADSVCRVPASRFAFETLELRCLMSASAGPTINATAANSVAAAARRVYMIGNSLTDAVNYGAFDALLRKAGCVDLGRQTGPGFTLAANYDLNSGYITSGFDPSDPNNSQPFGDYKNAFASFGWDDVTLQTNERHIASDVYNGQNQAEVPVSIKFMETLAAHSPHAQVFIYERPVRRNDVTESLVPTGELNNYSASYLQTYDDTNRAVHPYYSRSFFEQLMPQLTAAQQADRKTKEMPAVKLIPAGEAWYNLDQEIKAGKFAGTGITDIKDFYADQSHPTGIGAYAIGLTFYSALTGKDPRGVAPTAAYIRQDKRLSNTKIQSLIQNAVYGAFTGGHFSSYLTKLGAPVVSTPKPQTGGPTPIGDTGGIRVTAFTDANGNGRYDAGDSLKRGVVVYIDSNDNGVLDNGETSITTNAAGRAVFSNVPVGTYRLRAETGMDAVSVSLADETVTVAANKTTVKLLGIVPAGAGQILGAGNATLRGSVLRDVNGDGVINGRDAATPLRQTTVWIDLNRDGIQQSYEPAVKTNRLGHYFFTDIPAGTYPIRQVVRDHWAQTSPTAKYADAFTVTAGKTRVVNFLSRTVPGTASISGYVTNDVDGNDVLDSTDVGLRGRTVYLDLNNNGQLDNGEPRTVTAARGAYSISGLYAGEYVIREILPPGWDYAGNAASAALQVTIDDGQAVRGLVILNKTI